MIDIPSSYQQQEVYQAQKRENQNSPRLGNLIKKKKQKIGASFSFKAVTRENRASVLAPNTKVPEAGVYHPKYTALEK